MLRPEAVVRRDGIDDRDGPLDGDLVPFRVQTGLLRELSRECLGQALAAVDAAAWEQPVLGAPLLVTAEQDAAVPEQDRRDADPRVGPHETPDEPKPASPRSELVSSDTSTTSTATA